MTDVYWDPLFINNLNRDEVEYVCEVGARYGDESIGLSRVFNNATILAFECNPNTVHICEEKLKYHPKIRFFNHGLGETETSFPFYSYTENNDGASSLLKRIDFDRTQKCTGNIQIKTLSSVLTKEDIPHVDLLCMDVQGYELNVLKGCGDFLSKINYVIMEEPKHEINTTWLPEGVHSKYLGAPTSLEIKEFMTANNFIEIARKAESGIEDNVMYKRRDL